jgi:sensor c-di-GMP phosphodiesterase-like protein
MTDIPAEMVISRLSARIGDLEVQVASLQAALEVTERGKAEAEEALAAVAHFRAQADSSVVPPDGWGSTGQALRANEAGYGPVD